jgi:hypothetical protein
MGWKGSQTNYVYYYKEQARKFNENSKDPYTENMLCQFMENSLTGVPNLEHVLQTLRSSQKAAGVFDEVTWPEYIATLIQHTQIHDAKNARQKFLGRRAEFHEIFDIDEDEEYGQVEVQAHDMHTPVKELVGYNAFQTNMNVSNSKTSPTKLVPMTFAAWKQLTPEDRASWDKISKRGRRPFLIMASPVAALVIELNGELSRITSSCLTSTTVIRERLRSPFTRLPIQKFLLKRRRVRQKFCSKRTYSSQRNQTRCL